MFKKSGILKIVGSMMAAIALLVTASAQEAGRRRSPRFRMRRRRFMTR